MKKYILILLITLTGITCKDGSKQEMTQPKLLDITEFVYASVNVSPKTSYFSRSTKPGIIEAIYVKKGNELKKGQALFSVNATADVNNRLNNATVNLQDAKENLLGPNNKLATLASEIERINKQIRIDSLNYERRKRLWKKEIGSKNQMEQTLLAYQASSSKRQSLEIEYQQTKNLYKNLYNKAKDLVDTEKSLMKDLIVHSKINGKVFNIFKEVGEYISPQENFAEIGETSTYVIEMNIDEVDISKINLGDTAIIHLEAYPDTVFTSTLVFISELKDKATQTFMVEGIFTERPPKLFSGLSGEANILIERRKNALTIPSNYIINGTSVLTQDGKTAVKVGVKNLKYVEIISGIDTTTTLIKPEDQ